MADIKDIKIQRRTYQFDIKKRVSLDQSYKKVEKPPLEKIKEALKAIRTPKGKVVLEEEAEKTLGIDALEQPKAKKKKASKLPISPNLLLKAGGGLILALLLLGSVLLYFQSTVFASEMTINPAEISLLSAEIQAYDVLTASKLDEPRQPYHTAFVRLLLEGQGVENLSVQLNAYDEVVPSSVYVLRTHRYQAETYPEFILSLKSNLSQWGIPVNEIGMDELGSLPSQSLVIVPSGYVPEQMLNNQNTKITNLLERGVSVLYIGQPFYRMYSPEGAVVSSNPAALNPFRVAFDESTALTPGSELEMRSPLYSLDGARLVWGAVSALSYESGYLITFPQTLDGGWTGGTAAASDVSKLIVQMPWLSPIGTASEKVALGENATLTELFTSTFEGNNKYLRVYGKAADSQLGFSKVIYAQKSTRGELYTQGHDIRPVGLGSTEMDIMVELNEPGGEARLFFTITEMLTEIEREPIATTKVALNSQPTFPFTFSLPSGDYILNIIDGDGNSYARSYLRAGALEIQAGPHVFSKDTYRFSFYLDGTPVPVTGSVYVNGNPSNAVSFENVNSIELDAAQMAGGPLAGGEWHTFTFQLGEYSAEWQVYKGGQSSLLTDPMILGAVGLSVIVLAIGFIFARKGVAMYGLDIPDFPPQSTKKIPMKKEKLLLIFEKINERYKWKDTPLTLSEVKSGFRGILHEGKPIFISDYNLEYLLSMLVGMGILKKELDYYGKTSWEKETENTVRSLAFFRKLRDVCINNAVPFTPLGKNKHYDSKISIIGQDIYVHLYDESGRVIANALSSLKSGLNIIIFEDEAEKSEFYEYLSSGYEGGTILKLEIQAGSVLLKTWDEFAKMVKEMKI